MARLHQKIRFYISFAFVNSIGWGWVWCRAYFQHNRALTFRDRPWIFEFWTAPIRFCSNVIKTAICTYIYVIKTCCAVRYIKQKVHRVRIFMRPNSIWSIKRIQIQQSTPISTDIVQICRWVAGDELHLVLFKVVKAYFLKPQVRSIH